MEALVKQLIADSMELRIPPMTQRRGTLSEVPGVASVIVGMRRTGKTYRMFQRMQELRDEGVEPHRLLYLGFEDERLSDVTVDVLGMIDEAYFRAFLAEHCSLPRRNRAPHRNDRHDRNQKNQ